MNQTLSWTVKNCIFPLSLFFISATVRYLVSGEFSMNLISPVELSFSMGILCFLIVMSATKLSDEQLGRSLSYLYVIFAMLFICICVISIKEQIEAETDFSLILHHIQEAARTNSTLSEEFISEASQLSLINQSPICTRLRDFSVIASIFTIIVSIRVKSRYKLEE